MRANRRRIVSGKYCRTFMSMILELKGYGIHIGQSMSNPDRDARVGNGGAVRDA